MIPTLIVIGVATVYALMFGLCRVSGKYSRIEEIEANRRKEQ